MGGGLYEISAYADGEVRGRLVQLVPYGEKRATAGAELAALLRAGAETSVPSRASGEWNVTNVQGLVVGHDATATKMAQAFIGAIRVEGVTMAGLHLIGGAPQVDPLQAHRIQNTARIAGRPRAPAESRIA